MRRVVLKISGEALQNSSAGDNISSRMLDHMAREISAALALGLQIAVVVGGGNIVRGKFFSEKSGYPRIEGDYMGMLATVINSMALQCALNNKGIDCRLHSALAMDQVAQQYIKEKAMAALKKGRVVLFAGGTGNPFFSTDTAAALRASEIDADLLLKGTKVEGVYTTDPMRNSDSEMVAHTSFDRVIRDRLDVMDATAITMCRDQNIPIHVFNFFTPGNLARVLRCADVGTRIDATGPDSD